MLRRSLRPNWWHLGRTLRNSNLDRCFGPVVITNITIIIVIVIITIFEIHGQASTGTAKAMANLSIIPTLKLPKPHVTSTFRGIVMLVWVALLQIGATQIAKMGIAFKTDHVVTTMRFLSPRVAGGTRLRM